MPDRQATADTAEISPALGDECGDEWLDTTEPVADDDNSEKSANSEDLIDLTSQELLVLFATYYSSTQTMSPDSVLHDSVGDSRALRTESETTQRVIRRARDINWD
ncbi:hypothetical protein RHS04_03705 [Rhizoctonia solani]|uniref:Uncharacterized protein n=1 Tax=Rhizoctonia solani TaxID=456999 RepID=A0A8H7LLN0_9AGAM|nr:hypothetical protein RHS04_03705 [Rhizoctonia solani]